MRAAGQLRPSVQRNEGRAHLVVEVGEDDELDRPPRRQCLLKEVAAEMKTHESTVLRTERVLDGDLDVVLRVGERYWHQRTSLGERE